MAAKEGERSWWSELRQWVHAGGPPLSGALWPAASAGGGGPGCSFWPSSSAPRCSSLSPASPSRCSASPGCASVPAGSGGGDGAQPPP